MSLSRFLLFENCFSLLHNNESGNTQQQFPIPANFPIELKCACLHTELDKFSTFNSEQWQFYLHQFDPYCTYCNLWKQSRNVQQITSKSTTINNGDRNEFICKTRFLLFKKKPNLFVVCLKLKKRFIYIFSYKFYTRDESPI